MNIGIFTYGTRGDLQPYIALALGLMDKGHKVTEPTPFFSKGIFHLT
jgi:UDP:flavonoid glycosyltransferase YjiC (YdhE family)